MICDHDMQVDGGMTLRQELERRLERSRELILGSLDGIDETSARSTPIAGRPSMLGIVRHASFVEAVWFHEAVTGESRTALGAPAATGTSWKVRRSDSIDSVRRHYRSVHAAVESNLVDLELSGVVGGKGRRTLVSIWIHVLDELSWNVGQLDMLRAAVAADRSSDPEPKPPRRR